MNKTIVCLFCIAIVWFSCSKKNNAPPKHFYPKVDTLVATIDGVTDTF